MPTLTDHMLREALEGVSKTLNNGSVVYGASASRFQFHYDLI